MADDRRKEILEAFAFFQEVDKDLRQEILDSATLAHLSAREYVFRQGQTCDKVVFLGRGSVRVFKVGDTGRELTLYRVQPGNACILNIACLAGNLNFPADAVAEEAVEAVTLPPKLFLEWIDRSSLVRRFVFRVMSKQFISLMLRVEDFALTRLDRRLAEYLISRSQADGRLIAVTHDIVAAELGSAREVISRRLKDFEARTLVRLRRGSIEVIDVPALEQLGREGGGDASG